MAPVISLKGPDVIRIITGSKQALQAVTRGDTTAGIAAAELIANVMREEIRRPGSGRVYTRPGGKTHQASAPGEPPTTDTGRLINAIATAITATGLLVTKVAVGVRLAIAYWRDLEFGTVRVAPRPFIRPAVQLAKAGAADIYIKKARAAVKRRLKARKK